MDTLLVTLCTYNERENLVQLIPEILERLPEAHILVIDDASPDGTGELVQEMATVDRRVHLLRRSGKLGLGTATLAGFRWGIERGYDLLINMDADFSHHPRYLPVLKSCLSRADVAIGSRYVVGGGVQGWGLRRHLMSRTINLYARLLLRLRTKDNSGSYRCYRIAQLARLDLDRVRARGYAFQEEILYRCRRLGCRFEEVPIIFEDRRYGSSKISWKEAVAAVWVIFRLGLENLRKVPVARDSKPGPTLRLAEQPPPSDPDLTADFRSPRDPSPTDEDR